MNRKQRRAAGNVVGGKSVSVEPIFVEAVLCHETGRLAEAERLYRKAIRLSPNDAEIPYNLGVLLMQEGRPLEAVQAWRSALAIRPDYPKALNNLGIMLSELDQVAEADIALRAALVHGPDFPETYNNLAIILRAQGRLEESQVICRRALALRPDFADALNSLGIVLQELGRVAESVIAYRLALRHNPDFPKAHFNLGLALLSQGDFSEGWREHEWRWKGGARHLKPRGFPQAEWRGERLDGQAILLHAEQGFGDTLQFVRFAPVVASLGGRVILEVQAPLVNLCRSLPGIAEIIVPGQKIPSFDRHLSLMSIPNILGVTLDSIPSATAYLHADDAAIERWDRRLSALPGKKVGLVWSGDPRPHDLRANLIDRRRSLRLVQLTRLLAIPGISFISLQMGTPKSQLADIAPEMRPLDFTEEIHDFADSAALITQLDLVITVDTAAAHLAGALNRPVWILSRFDGCWRWLLDRDDSPWYPSARLFRQKRPGDWDEVIGRVADRLALPPGQVF